jgi:VWFA-related protein
MTMTRSKSFFALALAVILLLTAQGILRSQDGEIPQIRTRVDLVEVPVSVRDDNGFLLTSLDPEDFTVFEDGKPQTISYFFKEAVPLSAAIVVDDGVSGVQLKRVASLISSITDGFKSDYDMISFRYDHLVWQLSEFTRDPRRIQQSLREVKEIAEQRPDEPEQVELYRKIEEKTPGIVKSVAKLFGFRPGAPPMAPSTAGSEAPAQTRAMHTAIYEASGALQKAPAIPGEQRRKIILLVSDGIARERQISLVPGKTNYSFTSNLPLLIKNEIQVYSVYTRGNLLEETSGMLERYAHETGGEVYGGRTESDMKFAFSRIAEQARTQYVLGYVSNNTAPTLGVYRKIEVRSGDRDQKRKVTYRQGYTQYPIPR